ncbi:hypothetical protein HID58_091441 [Brassica napus]|uniref:Uncharacterized protein n=1 Tax=Brassica napus TaxID=3708 RepID=A0ABQ7X1H0_BRANA|nr:hypothetical protein HID58_091441 [Brassica napus]
MEELDQASVAAECLPSAQPDSSFSEISMRRSKPSPWCPAVLGLLLSREDTSLPAVYATGQSSGQRPPEI